MGPTALLPLRRKACWGFFCPEKIRRLRLGLNPRTWVPKASPCILVCITLFMACMTDKKNLLYVLIETHRDDKCEKKSYVFYLSHNKHFPTQHWPTCVHNREGKCLLRGTSWIQFSFVNEISSPPPDFNDNFALLCISSNLYVQPEDGLTGRGRNM